MPSTFWPTKDLDEARADQAQESMREMLAGFEERTRSLVDQAQQAAAPKPAPFTFDRSAFMPWLSGQSEPATPQQPAQQTSTGLFDRDALMPWKPKPEPSRAVTTPAATGVAAPQPITATGTASAAPNGVTPSSPSTGYAPSSGRGAEGVEQWSSIVSEAAKAYGLPESTIKGLMEIESGGNPQARSAAGAMGLMQVMPFHFGQGEDGMDPRTNIFKGAKVYADALRRYGDPEKAAAAYFGAIDANGNITGATDATGTDGHKYVALWRAAAAKYGGAAPGANAAPAPAASAASPPAPPAPAVVPPQPAAGGSDWITVRHKRTGTTSQVTRDQWENDVTNRNEFEVVPSAPQAQTLPSDRLAERRADTRMAMMAGGEPMDQLPQDTGQGLPADPAVERARGNNPIQYDAEGNEIPPQFTPGPPNQIRYDIYGNERPDKRPGTWMPAPPAVPTRDDPYPLAYRAPLDPGAPVRDRWADDQPQTPPEPAYDPRAADEGAHEAIPSNAQQSPQAITATGSAEVAPQSAPLYGPSANESAPPSQATRYVPSYAPQAAQVTAEDAPRSDWAGAGRALIDAGAAGVSAAADELTGPSAAVAGARPPETAEEVAWASAPATARAVKIVSDTTQAFGAAAGRKVAEALGYTDEPTLGTDEFETPAVGPIPSVHVPAVRFSPQDVGAAIGSTVADPTNWALPGSAADAAADLAIRNLAAAPFRGARAAVRAGTEAVQGAGQRAARGLAENASRVAAADARAAEQGSTQLPGVFGVSGIEPNNPAVQGMRPRVVPPEVADTLDFPIRVPDDPRVVRAIEAAGGTVDERGVTLNVIRNQGPEAAGGTAARGGMFYIAAPPGSPNPYATTIDAASEVGGTQRIEGPTRFRSPLIISGEPGGSGFDEAIRELGWAQTNRPLSWWIEEGIVEARRAGPEGSAARNQAIKDLVSRYGGDASLIDEQLRFRGADASEATWTIKENILTAQARRQGYDGVVTVEHSNPSMAEINQHPAVVAAQTAKDEATVARSQAIARGATGAERDAVDAEYARAYEAHEAAVAAAKRELASSNISELVDTREGRNPTPGAIPQAVLDAQAAERAAFDRWMSRPPAERGAAMEVWKAARQRLDEAITREGATTPPGYTLRSDVPRRPETRASTIAENPRVADAERAMQSAEARMRAADEAYRANPSPETSQERHEARMAFNAARTAFDALEDEPRHITANASAGTVPAQAPTDRLGAVNRAAPRLAPEDRAPLPLRDSLGAAARTLNTEALNAAGGAFAGNLVSGDIIPDPNDQRSPEERLRDALIHGGVGAAAAILTRHGLRKVGGVKGLRAALGNVSDEAPRYDPRLAREPVMEGFEPPRRTEQIPNISDEPNRPGNRLGNVPPSQIREPVLPGTESVPARREPTIGLERRGTEQPNRPPNLGDIPPSQVREPMLPGTESIPARREPTIGLEPRGPEQPSRPRTLADVLGNPERDVALPGMGEPTGPRKPTIGIEAPGAEAAKAAKEMQATGSPSLPEMRPLLVQRIRKAIEPWIERSNTLRYAGMLSDTAGHVQNIGSNIVLQLGDIGSGVVSAAIDAGRVGALRAARQPAERQVFFHEVPARLAGMRAGARAGLEEAGSIMRTGVKPDEVTKLEQRGGKGFNSGNTVVDALVETPLRALAAADAIFRGAAVGGHGAAEAYAAARIKNGGKAPSSEQIRAAMHDPKVRAKIDELSARSVLQEDRRMTSWWRDAMKTAPPEVRAIASIEMPFVKTPYNVMAQGMGMTPAGLVGAVQDVAQGKAARDVEQRLARVAMGTAVMGLAAADYGAGNLTGPYPSDPAEASTLPPGWRPWSRKFEVGGETYYVPLAYLGPFAVPAVVAILGAESAKQGKEALSAEWTGKVALGLGQYAEQNTFFEGFGAISKIFDGRTGEANIERQLESTVAQFSPHVVGGGALGREIQRVMGMPARDPDGMIEALLATHPATADMVRPRQDVLGREQSMGVSGPAAAVMRAGVENDDPVIAAFRDANQALPRSAPKQIQDPSTKQDITLDPDQRAAWREAFGQALQERWASSGYAGDAKSLASVASKAREDARRQVLGR